MAAAQQPKVTSYLTEDGDDTSRVFSIRINAKTAAALHQALGASPGDNGKLELYNELGREIEENAK